MESEIGKGLKALFPKIPGEMAEEEAVDLGKVSKRRSPAPQPARGLDAIFSPSPFPVWKFASVSLSKIRIPEYVDRSRGGGVESLKDSISSVGLLFPVLLRKEGEGFELVAGWRRLEALKELGGKRILARVAEIDQRQAARIYRESNSAN